MNKLTKRAVVGLKPDATQDVFAWDSELRGFGVRIKPTGVKTYLVQYRNADGRTRRLVLGKHNALPTDQARALARQKLAAVARGEDPSAQRHAARAGMTVAEVCDWYLEEGRAGRLLGRKRRPIKSKTLNSDASRIITHIKPLLGAQPVRRLTLPDIEKFQASVAAGRTAIRAKRKGRGGRTTGGPGVASRTISTLRSLLGHAKRWGLIEVNPALGVRQIAIKKKDRRLSVEEVIALGATMRAMEREGEHPTALAAIRLMLLTGLRRMEVLGMQWDWVCAKERCIRYPDTKSDEQVRIIGQGAVDLIESRRDQNESPWVFPADWGEGHFVGAVRVLERVCAKARIDGVTPHVLRHTFASIAAEMGFTELTIAGLLGHASRGITQRYIHLDAALMVAADKVSDQMARLLDGRDKRTSSGVEHRLVAE